MPDVNHSAATVLHDSKATALTVGTDTPSRADILVYNDAASGGLYRTTGTSGTGDVQKVGLNSDDIANFETTTELNARDTANRDRANHTGTQAISTVTNLQTTLDTKLESSDIANFETTTQLNARDTANRDRANHTGTQLLATISDAGTAAALDVGTSANNVVQLDGSARLPAVDGSQLTGIAAGATAVETTITNTWTTTTTGSYVELGGTSLRLSIAATSGDLIEISPPEVSFSGVPTYFRLERSTDGGSNWTAICLGDAAASKEQVTWGLLYNGGASNGMAYYSAVPIGTPRWDTAPSTGTMLYRFTAKFSSGTLHLGRNVEDSTYNGRSSTSVSAKNWGQ